MRSIEAGVGHGGTRLALAVRGAVAIAIGVLVLARPLTAVVALAMLIAVWALVAGVSETVCAFGLRPLRYWWLLLLSGVIGIVFGAASLLDYPTLSLTFAVAWVAFAMLTAGLTAISLGRAMRADGWPSRWAIALGLVSIAVAVVAALYPAVTLTVLLGAIAVFGIVSGGLMLLAAVEWPAGRPGDGAGSRAR